MHRPLLALVLTVAPGVAAAQVAVDVRVQTPRVHVAVGTPPPADVPVADGPVGPSPGPGYVWQPGGWAVDQNGARVYQPGHWRPVPVAEPVVYQPVVQETVIVESAPPAPIVEVRPSCSIANAVWIPGYWQWARHRYVWVGGRWSAPRPGYVWEPHRWVHRGHDRRWAWQAGFWRHAGGPSHRHDGGGTWQGRPPGWDRHRHDGWRHADRREWNRDGRHGDRHDRRDRHDRDDHRRRGHHGRHDHRR